MLESLIVPWALFLAAGILVMAVAVLILVLKWKAIHQRIGVWGTVGTMLGWFMIFLGLLGGLLPIIPGFPMGILGLLLLGPRDPVIRWFWSRLHRWAVQQAHSSQPTLHAQSRRFLRFERRLIERVFAHEPVPEWLLEGVTTETLEGERRTASIEMLVETDCPEPPRVTDDSGAPRMGAVNPSENLEQGER